MSEEIDEKPLCNMKRHFDAFQKSRHGTFFLEEFRKTLNLTFHVADVSY